MLKQACRLNSVYQRLVRSIHSQPDALNVTTKAVQKLRQIAEDGEFLRISVEGGGCSGFEYKLKLDKQKWPDDVLIEKGGANVVVDEVSFKNNHLNYNF
jgi:iron-sulfur cluster assembly accessory protein